MKKIAVLTGKRGGFGALISLIELMYNDSDIEVVLLATDMHLRDEFGSTISEVEKYFEVGYRISMATVDDIGREVGDTKALRVVSLSNLFNDIAYILNNLHVDMLVVLGDRSEVLVACMAAFELGIPVAHILGGDVSGSDDGVRIHAITKLSHLHFPSSLDSYNRIIRLGEQDWRVHNFGATYVDRIINKLYARFDEISYMYNVSRDGYFICIYHPVGGYTESFGEASRLFEGLIEYGTKTVLLYPCSDPGYSGVICAINKYSDNKIFDVYKNIPVLHFHGLLEGAKMIIGNSSCGLIEAPYFDLLAVNIVGRQRGRVKDENVVDVGLANICDSIEYALGRKFKNNYLFGKGDASRKIFGIISKYIGRKAVLLSKSITY